FELDDIRAVVLRSMDRKLAHFVLAGGRGKQQSVIDRVSQATSRRNVSTQIGDNYLLGYDSASRPRVGSISRPGDTDNGICEPKRGSVFVKNKGRMRQIANRDCSNFLGTRFGIICHDGSYHEGEDCLCAVSAVESHMRAARWRAERPLLHSATLLLT